MDCHHDNDTSNLQAVATPSVGWQTVVENPDSSLQALPREQGQLSNPYIQGRSVTRAPEDLHIHPALLDLHGTDGADELNDAERVRHHATTPVLVTSEGTILSGFGHWRSALLHEEREIPCIEYVLSEEESLQFILIRHKPQQGWNAFVRTSLALTLEPYFQHRGLVNMQDGGRYKGSAKLPNPQHIDVRREIAEIAGVGARNVSNVKIILKAAHPRLLSALRDGSLTINKAMGFCKMPLANQLDAFVQLEEERAIDGEIRRALTRNRKPEPFPDTASILNALQQCESQFPGSVLVKRSRSGRMVVSASDDVLKQINSQQELSL